MTKLSFEVPIYHLKDFDDLQDFYFMLSFLFTNDHYYYFHSSKALRREKELWLDNSYNETKVATNVEELVKIAKNLNVTKVLAPDYPTWGTGKIFKEYAKTVAALGRKKVILIAPTKNIYQLGKLAGVKTLAYPVLYDDPINYLNYQHWITKCHMLGMISVDHLRRMAPPSCDTGMPIKIAMKGWTLNEWTKRGSPHISNAFDMPNYFNSKLNAPTIRLARKNITDLKILMTEEMHP